ncbi:MULTISPECIES: hypothetical protein [Streptomyces]|uniref:Uncharacterized protein n=1 Tax=Streptomyces apricus TaxID=1828112 RepID=A0A5B0AZK0_9ACTN|nr:hypothetical protein [Streptomyces apricus]KAA0934661.1 hypothetical protein FGF04_18065 [Streptomyces apricus]
MSAPPPEPSSETLSDPYAFEFADGPQTLAELRTALSAIGPEMLAAFDARLDAATFGWDHDEVIAKARRAVAFKKRAREAAAEAAAQEEAAGAQQVDDPWAHLDVRDSTQ